MWAPEDIASLIGLYKKRPVLYLKSHPHYSYYGMKSMRQQMLDEIQTEMQKLRPHTTLYEIMNILNELTGGYQRLKTYGSSALDDISPPLLRFIDFMSFSDVNDGSTQTSPMLDGQLVTGSWGKELNEINTFLETASDERREDLMKVLKEYMRNNSVERPKSLSKGFESDSDEEEQMIGTLKTEENPITFLSTEI